VRGDDGVLLALLLVADDRIRDAFTPEEILLLEGLSAQLGVVLANCRVYTRMKDRDRLAALGSMAAGLAHEVKNPLGAIKGAAQLLEEELAESREAQSHEFVGIILEEVERLNRIVGSFLDYARPQSGSSVPVDINAVVKRTIQILMSQRVDDAIEIQTEFAEDLPRVSIDPEKLRQVLMNLVQNAEQAMEGRGCVTVTTAARRQLRTSIASAPLSERLLATGAVPTDVEISVRDTGSGISPKVRKNLFVPFFTTKVEGTGLGLAISQSIVQSAGGRIDVESQAGAGTRFTIVLPVGVSTVTPLPGGSLSDRPPPML
jgi:signal transduction histidine kinase